MVDGFCPDEPDLPREPLLEDAIPLEDVANDVVSLFDRGMGGGWSCSVI